MSTQIDLGPVLSIPKGDWNASTTYERLNLVRHNSAAWICNVDTSIGVEPSEDSVDWFLQVKDTSAVSSVNGMKGDVEITTIQTPSNDSNDTSIANTEWVRDRIDETINSTHSYIDDTISAATTSILDAAAQDASNKAVTAVNQALASSDAKFATKETVSDLADSVSTLEENYTALDAAVVHKTGDEEISGEKTFTSDTFIKKSSPFFKLNADNMTIGTKPSKNTYAGINVFDTTNTEVGGFFYRQRSSGATDSYISSKSIDGSVVGILGVYVSENNVINGFAPNTPAGSTGNQIVTADFLQTNQTMAGDKTFTGVLLMKRSTPDFYHQLTNLNKGTIPTSNNIAGSIFVDKNGTAAANRVGALLSGVYKTSGISKIGLYAYQPKAGGTASSELAVVYPVSGSPYANAPTPAADSNTNHIATTAWVRGKGVLVESWHNGTSWYRKYSDGWIEQGGNLASSGTTTGTTTLHLAFTSTNYTVLFGMTGGTGSYSSSSAMTVGTTKEGKTTTNFKWNYCGTGNPTIKAGFFDWYACGF